MAANIAEIRRNIKNVAHNYTDAQVKVRAATSNDPWGPSSTQMCEIADLTYNVIAFSEIMQMIWKRVNDSGKNWRHVYKALVLLEYLIKTGSEKVAAQCKENLFSIQTLKDFQFIEENKDQGLNVREKAKALVSLLKDDEKLKNERVKALKAKERFSQSTAGIGSDTTFVTPGDTMAPNFEHREEYRTDLDMARGMNDDWTRPQTAGEEELQLQLALAMSREEAETEENKQKSDEMRLKLAIEKSKEENKSGDKIPEKGPSASSGGGNALLDLADINFGNPAGGRNPAPPQRTQASMDPWNNTSQPPPDPWGAAGQTQHDPWGSSPTPGQQQGAQAPPPASVYPNLSALGAVAVVKPPPTASDDPWGPLPSSAPQNPGFGGLNDPWGSAPAAPPPSSPQPWAGGEAPPSPPTNNGLFSQGSNNIDILSGLSASPAQPARPALTASPSRLGPPAAEPGNPWDLSMLDPMNSGGASVMNDGSSNIDLIGGHIDTGAKPKKSVESLLGEHSKLVDLDSLVKAKPTNTARNPFSEQPNPFQAAAQPNLFQAAAAPKPSMNELRTSTQQAPNNGSAWPGTNQSNNVNPFF